MESRQEARFEVDQEVTVTLLGDVETTVAGKIVNVSGTGLCVRSNEAISPGTPLKIELADTLVLGEVIYCRPQEEFYCSGISLGQALYHTRQLAALAQRLLGRDIRDRGLRERSDAGVERRDEHGQEADHQHNRQTIGDMPAA